MASVRVILCLAVVALFAFVQMGEGVTCYSCLPNTECKTDATVDCTGDKKCMVIRDEDGKIYQQGCGTDKECKLFADCSTCDKEKCNSSPVTMPSFLIIGVAGLVLAKYFY